MTPTEVSQYLAIALASISLLAHAKGFFSAGEKELKDKVKEHGAKLADHDSRIQRLENTLEHLPDKETVVALRIALTELKGDLNTLGETVSGVSRTVTRIDDYLRQKADA